MAYEPIFETQAGKIFKFFITIKFITLQNVMAAVKLGNAKF